MSKVSVKYYLNKNLKSHNGRYPVYIRIIHKRNPQRVVSNLFCPFKLSDTDFEKDDLVRHVMRKGETVILDFYNFIDGHILKDFDIREYKNLSITHLLYIYTQPFLSKLSDVGQWGDINSTLDNFFSCINEKLGTNIKNPFMGLDLEFAQNFYYDNITEFCKLGLVESIKDKYFNNINLDGYKYNIENDTDRYIIDKAKEYDKMMEDFNKKAAELSREDYGEALLKLYEENERLAMFSQVAKCLYMANYYNFMNDEKLQRTLKRNGVAKTIGELMIKEFNGIITQQGERM